MKKIYTLLAIVALSFSAVAQVPMITGILDGDCSGGNPKALELYANGTVDFSLFSLENQTNATVDTWSQTLSLAPLGIVTNAFVYVIQGDAGTVNIGIFNTEFPGIPAANIFVYPIGSGTPQPLNINGDDRVRLINTATTVVIDQYGESNVDGSTTAWEYTDSWAKRNNGTLPTGAFVPSNWTYGGVAAINNLGVCQGAAAFSTVVPFGQYSLGVNQNQIQGLKVYPNPVTNGTFYINTNTDSTKEVVVYDVLGKQVVKTTTNNAVNVSNLKGGVYIVKITEEGKTATRKLVIR